MPEGPTITRDLYGGGRRTFFPHLHLHDEFSIKDGCSSVEAYADLVVDMNGSSLCVTNHGQAAGWARQYFACKDRGIKPIYGMEAYVNPHRKKPIRRLVEELKKRVKKKVPGAQEELARAQAFVKEKFRPSPHAVVLAKSRAGYRNLVKMSTDSWLNGYYYVPRTDIDFLADHREGLVFSTACIGGYLTRMARNDFPTAVEEGKRLQGIFGDDFYVELMITEYDMQRETNRVMLKLAHELKAKTIVTCDVHYAKQEDGLAQDVLLLMRDKKTIKDKEAGEGVWQFDAKDLWWRSLEDVARCWRECHSDYMDPETFKEAVRNTYALAEEVEGWDFDTSLKLPGIYDQPEGNLKLVAVAGLKDRVARGECPASGRTNTEYVERLRRELTVVNGKGFAEYFLILKDVCDHARSIGARTGPGRGSAGGSLLAFVLGITEIDPLRFNLLFERFLDPERPDAPDIDLDFSPQHRDGIKQYVEDRYPATATIGTYATFKPRATLRDVGKVFGVDWREMVKITKPLETDADKLSWDEIFGLYPDVRAWAQEHPEAWNVVQTLRGLISHRGKHAAAMLIAPASALDEVPMITESTGQVVTAFPDTQGDGVTYEGREMSRLGYLKLDILGVRTLNVAPLAAEILERDTGQHVDLGTHSLPLDDPGALETANRADVPGVFQLDSSTSRGILKTIGVDAFSDLVMATALARPGPLENRIHEEFAKLKRSGDAWKRGVDPDLVPLLQDSRGLMVLQEDVMHVVQVLGGLTFPEANKVRKVMAKKLDPEAFLPWKEKFVEGGLAMGRAPDVLEDTWQKIETFCRYGFNKAHSVAYMLTAFRQLYMLTHHSLYYFAALLAETPRGKKTTQGEEKVPLFMREAAARGHLILPPCVLRSELEFDVEGTAIRYGLSKVKGVASAAGYVVAARPFASLEDLFDKVERRRVNARVFKTMIDCGALDDLPFESPLLYDDGDAVGLRNALHARLHGLRKAKDDPPRLTTMKLQEAERELLGSALSWWSSPEKDDLREAAGLETIAWSLENDVTRLNLLVEVARAKPHKGRRGVMAFLTLSDETGTLDNVVLWAEQWKKWRDKLKKGRLAIVRLRRRENDAGRRRYGRWSYHLEGGSRDMPVESAQRALREYL